MKKLTAVAAIVPMLATGLNAAPTHAASTRHSAPQVLVIGTDLPLQGSSADTSADTNRMLQLYLARRNHRAGTYQVKLKAYDDSTAAAGQWDDAQCARNAQHHVANRPEVAVLGTFNSGCAAIEIPTLNRAGLLMVSHSNTYPGLTRRWDTGEPGKYYPTGHRTYARVTAPDNYEGNGAARLLHGTLRKNRVYVLDDGYVYGRKVANAFVAAARRHGITVVGRRTWDARRAGYRAMFRSIKTHHPTAIFIGGIYDNNGGPLLRDERAVFGGQQVLPVVTSDGFSGYPELDNSRAGRGLLVTYAGLSSAAILHSSALARQLAAAFRAKYGRMPSSVYAYQAIAAMQVICKAIAQSNGTRSSVVRQVFRAPGISIPLRSSAIGRAFRISTRTGDTNIHDITVEVIRSRREQVYKTIRF